VQDFSKLRVWQRAEALAADIYTASQGFPSDEVYGLTAQMKRAAISVPSNIAEGAGRESNKEFARFLAIASGSVSELESQITFASAQGFLNSDESGRLRGECIAIRRMLAALRARLTEH
jgi:four helix bundle protein